MGSGDDEIRMIKEGWRLLGSDVQAELIARGWEVTDLHVSDDEPLEFFWPPRRHRSDTGGLPDRSGPSRMGPSGERRPRPTPWTQPTRITRTATGWRVEYGEAIAQAPDEPIEHTDDKALLGDLARIEWWPMTVAEAYDLEHQQVLHLTYAAAHNEHTQSFDIKTEPYLSRIQELYDRDCGKIIVTMADPDGWKWSGDLKARMRIVDAQMWASAVRTARAGGDGWDTSGPKRVPGQP